MSGIEGKAAEADPAPTFTWQMLCRYFALANTTPEAVSANAGKIPLIIGSDALARIESWHAAEKLLAHCVFLEAPRPGTSPVKNMPGLDRETIATPPCGLSASWIRTRAAAGDNLRYAVPEKPRTDIEAAYRAGGPG